MIRKTNFRDILTIFGLSIALTVFITRTGFSQDTTKTKGDKKIKMVTRVVEDKNGKRLVFDTTINLDRRLKPGKEKQMMREFEIRFNDLDDQMKDLEVELNEMRLPDSGMMDSVQKLTERAFRFRGGPGNFHFRRNFSPRAFNYNYNFDMPELPERPQPLIEEFNDENTPGEWNEETRRMFKGKGESLNDLLGDIPMNNVRSYSIRDTKNGKRITIELNNEPLIEHQREVIIMRSPRPEMRHRQGQRHQMQKRIIIKNEE